MRSQGGAAMEEKSMLEGLMQNDFPLTVSHLFGRMRTINGDKVVVTLGEAGTESRTYGEVGQRVDRLCAALQSLGIGAGDRVATFMWNSSQHLEIYMGVPCMGAVLHTLNVRLFAEQLAYIANHAQDQIVFVDDSLVPVLEKVAPEFESVRHYVVVGDGDAGSLPNVLRYEDLIASAAPDFDYPDVDERAAAGLCYTSGTTGHPKGVLYSHRSNVLHSMATCMADTLAINWSDRVLSVVPMFHANAWGLPYACAMSGADMIMPARFLQGEPLAKLIEQQRVTLAAGVPTVWLDLLRYVDEQRADLSSLRMIVCGGAAMPEALARAFHERHNVEMVQAWGMTEMSPIGSVAKPPQSVVGTEEEWSYRTATGRIVPLVEARLTDDDGKEVPRDGSATGEVEVRGPWIASDYYEDPSGADKFRDGWLRTGDIATIDGQGFMRISDRSKDVIKSGGEWISSVELENHLMAHPDVVEAAVIATPDEKWSERPLACVVIRSEATVTSDELREHLAPRVAKWWMPDDFAFIEAVPKTSVGKFDKKALREALREGRLEQSSQRVD
ncbi:MAG: long-chain fatty acid--CoA ligase [Solirubrobacterales bacterium]